MTPGKQAMIALTLVLSESEEAWPLLIDQPEDDLDSRSIYDVLVALLARKKCGRQSIMVTHDANLVIGADSEQVVVANRRGHDRQMWAAVRLTTSRDRWRGQHKVNRPHGTRR
jgi:ABC-type lipoprotein export system ATPase subunit